MKLDDTIVYQESFLNGIKEQIMPKYVTIQNVMLELITRNLTIHPSIDIIEDAIEIHQNGNKQFLLYL